MQKVKTVFRIDTGRTHGWQVRIVRDGDRYTRRFTDSVNEAPETLAAQADPEMTVEEMIETAVSSIAVLLEREGDEEYA